MRKMKSICKKIIPVLFAVILAFVPYGSAFAAEKVDLVKGISPNMYNANGNLYSPDPNYTASIFDGVFNSTSKSFTSNRYMNINLDSVSDISDIYVKVLTRPDQFYVVFYSELNQVNEITRIYFNTLTQGTYKTIDVKGVKSIKLVGTDTSGNNIYDFQLKGYQVDGTPPGNVTGLTAVGITENSFNVSWSAPGDSDLDKFRIYLNGTLKDTVPKTTTSYAFSSLSAGTEYNVKITSLDANGHTSKGTSINVTTLEPLPPPPEPLDDVTSLNATESHNKVELNFVPPASDRLKHMEIYRDGEHIGTVIGNSYTDATVKPSTKYEYTVKTVSIEDLKSKGVKVSVTTKEEPPPKMEGVEFTNLEGDYVVTWTKPTTGTVKVLVGGKEYKTVPAELMTTTVPREDLKYTALGEPDITLIPISENGKEGSPAEPEKLPGLTIPFTPNDLVLSSNKLLLWMGPFLLLALAFLVVPKLKRSLFQALGKGKQIKGLAEVKERRFKISEQEQSERQEKEPKPLRERQERAYVGSLGTSTKATLVKEPRIARTRAEKTPRREREAREPRMPRESNREPRIPRERRGN